MVDWYGCIPFPQHHRLCDDEDNQIKICLGPNCGKISHTNPEMGFKKCGPCFRELGIFSYYCSKACSTSDWRPLHKTIHDCMLFSSGEKIPEMGYNLPVNYSGCSMHSGPIHDGTRVIYMNSRLPALYEAIGRLLSDYGVIVANRVGGEIDA